MAQRAVRRRDLEGIGARFGDSDVRRERGRRCDGGARVAHELGPCDRCRACGAGRDTGREADYSGMHPTVRSRVEEEFIGHGEAFEPHQGPDHPPAERDLARLAVREVEIVHQRQVVGLHPGRTCVINRPCRLGGADGITVALVEGVAARDVGVDELRVRLKRAGAGGGRNRKHAGVAVVGADRRGGVGGTGASQHDGKVGHAGAGADAGHEADEPFKIEVGRTRVPRIDLVLTLHPEESDELVAGDLARRQLRVEACLGHRDAVHEVAVAGLSFVRPKRNPGRSLRDFQDRDLVVRIRRLQHLGHARMDAHAAFGRQEQPAPCGVVGVGGFGVVEPRLRPGRERHRACPARHVGLSAEHGHADHAGCRIGVGGE